MKESKEQGRDLERWGTEIEKERQREEGGKTQKERDRGNGTGGKRQREDTQNRKDIEKETYRERNL